MIKRFALLTVLFSFLFANNSLADDLVVVELFSSQGCEKCPPANRLLSNLAKDKNILALSWHVDYWDFQGWKDTLADPEYTLRQENYNKSLGRKGVYTPQIIINGRRQIVGSDKLDLYQNIQAAVIANELPLTVRLDSLTKWLQVSINGPKDYAGAVVKLVWFDSLQKIKIKAGGNAGKTISYVNVVRSARNLIEWDGNPVALPLDPDDPNRGGANWLAVIVQDGETGPILGAAKVKLD